MPRILLIIATILYAIAAVPQSTEPLVLIRSMEMPNVPLGPYMDHFGVDVQGHRVFATPQASKTVQVFDFETGKFLHEVTGIGNPHGVFYRGDLDQFYVVDGGGAVKIFSGRDYHLVKSVDGLVGVDSSGYDPKTKEMYIVTGGKGAQLDYSALAIVDTTQGEKVGEIRVPGAGHLEQIVIDQSGPRLYVNIEDKNEVAVMDKEKRTLIARWPVTKGRNNVPIALDEKHQRLFVGTRDADMTGSIVIFDTETGNELQALPVGGDVDYMDFDPVKARLYATCGVGHVYVFQEQTPNEYKLLGDPDTAIMAKTGLLVPELNIFFVGVPNLGGTQGPKILEFRVQ